MEITKFLFIHNTVMWYRIPFFSRLSEIDHIEFLVPTPKISANVCGAELPDEIKGLENVNNRILKGPILKRRCEILHELLMDDFDVLVDSIQSIFSFIIAKLRKKYIIFWSEEWNWKKERYLKTFFVPFLKDIALF